MLELVHHVLFERIGALGQRHGLGLGLHENILAYGQRR
jgi:hypothetical protein